jgi:hypothetical protein
MTHRAVMEDHIGRRLLTHEIVHHVNGDPSDNRLENLQVVTPLEHARMHRGFDARERTHINHSIRLERELLDDFQAAIRTLDPEDTSARAIRRFMRQVIETAEQRSESQRAKTT